MNRREAMLSLAAATTTVATTADSATATSDAPDFVNPYEGVDWETWGIVHSMSHQHQGTTDNSRDVFRDMGYGHFAFSNYYASAPTDLPKTYREANPDIVWSPNAEQHSFLDSGLHANSLGSRLATGYGRYLSAGDRKKAPIQFAFEGLHVFDEQRPWEGVYRFDLRLAKVAGDASSDDPAAKLTLTGAHVCNRKESFADEGPVQNREFAAGDHTIYVRATSETMGMTLTYSAEELTVGRCRLMQGTNRPWREMFQATFDELLHPDGGGITLNHPTGKLETYIEMLDVDQRVLGIEVWNQLTSGFGSNRGFYASMKEPPAHFYQLWDQILSTGRRCWGFFVKDHNTYGRGRNILLAPPLTDLSSEEREAALLRAYRNGTFFGSIASIATDQTGKPIMPFDLSDLRFSRIHLRRNAEGRAVAVEAAVSGNDENLRPNVQIRFITDQGIASVIDGAEGEFSLPVNDPPKFIRVEAIAYPNTHLGGKPLDSKTIRNLSPAQIARLHDNQFVKRGGPNFFGNSAELQTPIPIIDQIFSQPILGRSDNLGV